MERRKKAFDFSTFNGTLLLLFVQRAHIFILHRVYKLGNQLQKKPKIFSSFTENVLPLVLM